MTSRELPCLFCFSESEQGCLGERDRERPRVERVYRFICDLLGVKLSAQEDYFNVFSDNESSKSFPPLCFRCSVLFRNLSTLQDELLTLQEKINGVALEIRGKISTSENDGTAALAIKIHSTVGQRQGFSLPQITSDRLGWMQRFRQRVTQQGESSVASNPQYVIVETGVHSVPQMLPEGFAVPVTQGESCTYYLSPSVITTNSSNPNRHPQQTQDYHDDDEYYPSHDDQEWSEPDSPLPEKPLERLKRSPQKSPRKLNKKSTGSRKTASTKAAAESESPTRRSEKRRRNPTKKGSAPKKPKLSSRKDGRTFKCHFCAKGFSRIYHLKMHLPAHTGQKNFACEICNLKFISRNKVALHNQECHGHKLPFCCPVCKIRRATNSTLQWHMKTHEYNLPTDPPYLCTKCNDGKEFRTKVALRRHIYSHSNPKNFSCPLCSSKFTRKDDMMTHMTRKHRNQLPEENKTFACNKCPMEFEDANRLITHLWSHGRRRTPMCQICRMSFQTTSELDLHNEEMHGLEAERLPCAQCDLVFTSKNLYKQHIRLHEPPKRFIKQEAHCAICDKTFYDAASLKRHTEVVHEDHGRPHKCPKEGCERAFKRSDDLRKHVKLHIKKELMGEKIQVRNTSEAKCEQCDVNFKSHQHLKRHNRTFHENLGRPFKCDQCTVAFKRKDDLKKHKRNKHNPETATAPEEPGPHYCEKCKKNFSTQDCLRKHIKVIHESTEADRFPCFKCDKTFKRDGDRRKHEKTAHGIEHESYRHPPARSESGEEEEPQEFPCSVCKNVYTRRDVHRRHEKQVHGINKSTRGPEDTFDYGDIGVPYNPSAPVGKDGKPKRAYCRLCKTSFYSNHTLKRHIKVTHGSNERSHECSICGKAYKRSDDLRKHDRVAHEGKSLPPSKRPVEPKPKEVHMCPYCEIECVNGRELRLHVLTHTGIKRPRKNIPKGSSFKIVVTTVQSMNTPEGDHTTEMTTKEITMTKQTKDKEEVTSQIITRSSARKKLAKEKEDKGSDDDDSPSKMPGIRDDDESSCCSSKLTSDSDVDYYTMPLDSPELDLEPLEPLD